jgi:hypothetical protein
MEQGQLLPLLDHSLGTKIHSSTYTSMSLKSHFALDDPELIYCGMALGYADETAAVNSLRSDRAPVHEFASFRDFA